jgi:hypothetical protein
MQVTLAPREEALKEREAAVASRLESLDREQVLLRCLWLSCWHAGWLLAGCCPCFSVLVVGLLGGA